MVLPDEEGRDWSDGKRIKFEIWECDAFGKMTVVLLHPNILMTQTLNRIVDTIEEKRISVTRLLVLSETSKRTSLQGLLQSLNEVKYSGIDAKEYSYGEFIWEECIAEDHKYRTNTNPREHYIPQKISDEDGNISSANEKLTSILIEKNDRTFHLLLGGGGIGKSSLCDEVISNFPEESHIIPLLISSEEIKSYLEDNEFNPDSIDNIYDLFEIQKRCAENRPTFDKKLFDISLISGSIALIIDGLDEFSSIFGEKFNTIKLLESLVNIHSELGSSKIIVTSRDFDFLENINIEQLNFETLRLLGFDDSECNRYLRKRFKDKELPEELIEQTKAKLQNESLRKDGRIVPFFAEVICDIYEDSSFEDETELNSESDTLPYECLGSVTDEIIFSIFKREKIRQKYPIEPLEMFELFSDFVAKLGRKWDINEVDSQLGMIYDENEKFKSISNSLKVNPLINRFGNECLSLKYDFTCSYFQYVFLVRNLIESSFNEEFINLLAKLNAESLTFNDFKNYFHEKETLFLEKSKSIIDSKRCLVMKMSNDDRKKHLKYLESATEFLFLVYYNLAPVSDKNQFTERVKSFFSIGDTNNFNGIIINGDLPALNFANAIVTKSRFKNYPNFLNSTFDNSKFIYTRFDKCENDKIKRSSILKAKIEEKSCELNDLDLSLKRLRKQDVKTTEMIESECRKFLRSFSQGQSLKDTKKGFIKFSDSVNALSLNNFHKLTRSGYLVASHKKGSETYYKINDDYQEAFRKFIFNGTTKSPEVREFLRFASS